jgi:hypothetical protein
VIHGTPDCRRFSHLADATTRLDFEQSVAGFPAVGPGVLRQQLEKSMRRHVLWSAMLAAGLLAACGGGGSNDGGASSGPLTLSGVIAKGAALANANVEAVCAAGEGSATADANGSYTLSLTDASPPCVLEATGVGADAGLVLHSVATGSGGTATSNITPVTELLVAQLTGQDPAAFMAAADASALNSAVTEAKLSAAKTEVVATLTAAGLDTAALTDADMVSGTLQAGTGAGYDGVLDALGTALTASGTTLAQMTQTVAAAASGSSPDTEASAPTSALPAGLLLRPKAATCDALRSTDYRIIKIAGSNGAGNAPTTAVEDMTFDATTLTADFGEGDTMAFTPQGGCRYTLPEGEAVVSPAGVIVMRHLVGGDDDTVATGDRGAVRLMIGLPKQDLAVADLAGEWALLGFDRNPLEAYGGYATVNATGAVSNFRCWDDGLDVAEASCTPIDSAYGETVTKNSNGSFSWASGAGESEPWTDTLFAYRAGNGDVLLVALTHEGEPTFGVKRRKLTLPTVGDEYANWTMLTDGNLVAVPATTVTEHAVVSVDAAAQTVVRSTTTIGGGTAAQTLVYNSGRDGYLVRTADTGVRPFNALAMPGFGLTAISMPNTAANTALFGLSARQ